MMLKVQCNIIWRRISDNGYFFIIYPSLPIKIEGLFLFQYTKMWDKIPIIIRSCNRNDSSIPKIINYFILLYYYFRNLWQFHSIFEMYMLNFCNLWWWVPWMKVNSFIIILFHVVLHNRLDLKIIYMLIINKNAFAMFC